MGKRRFRWYLDEGLFVLLVMAAATASAALEAGAVIGGLPGASIWAFAKADAAERKAAAARAASGPAFASREVAALAR